MTNKIQRFVWLGAGTLLFNYVFWQQSLGLNLLIYTVFVLLAVAFLRRRTYTSPAALATIAATFLLSCAVAFHASLFAQIMYFFSAFFMLGFLQQPGLRSLSHAAVASLHGYTKAPGAMKTDINLSASQSGKLRRAWRFVRLTLVPLLVLLLFYEIYIQANPVFKDISFDFFRKTGEFLNPIFKHVSFLRLLFLIWGFSIALWFVYKMKNNFFEKKEAEKSETIRRKRRAKRWSSVQPAGVALKEPKRNLRMNLKNEFRSALLLIAMLNVLLLIVNVIDISWVWFGFEYSSGFDLKQFVHEGTYLLILSILLSMAIMLYFFRRNLNFYPKRRQLQVLTYAWIGQNLFLTFSVAMRNFHYITYYGLAYKRIGVIIFLILVIFGLYTLFVKIRKTKSAFFLFRANGWAMFLVVSLFALADWDTIIARHNVNHRIKDNIETSFLLTLGDQTLPIIDQHKEVLDQPQRLNFYRNFAPFTYHEVYEKRKKEFLERKQKQSWLSWNYAEHKALIYYKNQK